MPPLSNAARQRGPTVLVTDTRELQRQRGSEARPTAMFRRQTSRLITVDNVLQYASDVPSMQQRFPPDPNRPPTQRTKSGRPAAPRLAGRSVPPGQSTNAHVPSRSTKVSEKLVLLPETPSAAQTDSEVEEKADFTEDNDAAPERDDEELLRRTGGKKGKSYAERLPKARRAEKQLSRVTAYCTAQAYKLKATAEFLKKAHGAKTKLYDDCLYAVYHLPLLPGAPEGGFRVRSSPVLKNPGGKAVLDEQIEQSERRDYQYLEDSERFSIRGNEDAEADANARKDSNANGDGDRMGQTDASAGASNMRGLFRSNSDQSHRSSSPQRMQHDALAFAEMFVFSYGVVVFWNFSERQEKDVLADLTFSSGPSHANHDYKGNSSFGSSPITHSPLVTNPLSEDSFETEEFHFEYSSTIPRPRVFNDMITLRSMGDHMIKLTISHPIAQSTKLSHFEQQMADQMADAQYVPKRLALTGKLGLERTAVVKILGALFKSRVEVNLSSKVLDTPNFFWDSEPTLHPLYTAVREYLEIKPRIQVLNERCKVFLDLAEILTDSIADTKMSRLTWIIIILILISILVTCSEVFLRFGLLANRTRRLGPGGPEPEFGMGILGVGGVCDCSLSGSGGGGGGGNPLLVAAGKSIASGALGL
ncbi:hypothetical protein MMC25_006381 [Agyrium rufum]|nr:hypothetical protein [Agyrium rufum]